MTFAGIIFLGALMKHYSTLKFIVMPENKKSIGSEGLEQGGPNLGNDNSRDDLSIKNAGDAFTSPTSMGVGHHEDSREKGDDEDLLSDYSELDVDDVEEDDNDI